MLVRICHTKAFTLSSLFSLCLLQQSFVDHYFFCISVCFAAIGHDTGLNIFSITGECSLKFERKNGHYSLKQFCLASIRNLLNIIYFINSLDFESYLLSSHYEKNPAAGVTQKHTQSFSSTLRSIFTLRLL